MSVIYAAMTRRSSTMKNQKATTNRRVLLVVIAIVAVLVGLPLALTMLDKRSKQEIAKAEEPVVATTPKAEPQAPKAAAVDASEKPTKIEGEEIHYLPKQVALAGIDGSPMLKKANLKEGTKRLRGVRKVTDKSQGGEFLSPKWSPDGLQMLASRPGYRGVYLIDVRTGISRAISEGGGYGAKWTPDGKIELRDEDGNIKTLNSDGTVDSTGAAAQNQQAYSENDAIYVRTPEGGTVPITSSDDKYFNPVVSPDGKSVVYQGLTTGLYMANADGSGEPVYIGRGNNAVWAPDSSGVIFDVTTDDGHMLTSGDLYYVDVDGTERTNLTPDSESIDEMPSVSPDGQQVAYESDGEIYVGTLN
ncbi:MAG TPA: hypothetical protein PKH51_00085 [Candidatus Sumerlaeota bacterium]|nr:hypothetical protein [Candidatus Sumerlaeota bacterium]